MHHTFDDLGPTQQRFIHLAFWEGVELDDPIATEKRVESLAGLIFQKRSRKGRVVWRTTVEGVRLYRTPSPVFLHRRGFPSYTSKPWQAMFGEPECVTDYSEAA